MTDSSSHKERSLIRISFQEPSSKSTVLSNVVMTFEPAYFRLLQSGELAYRAEEATKRMSCCDLCGHACKVDRNSQKPGVCRTGSLARMSSFGPHLGEEDPLRGWRGSGTVFFTRCNLKCQYCQNYDISQSDAGQDVGAERLAAVMLELQAMGCHNINLVSPSHVVAAILSALLIAARAGLHLPLVFNTGGYDSLEALRLLDGIIDIYMPDMKYADEQTGLRYSHVKDYPAINQLALREMYRQVGDLALDWNGLATRGLLVRHLILPNNLAGTAFITRFLAEEISRDTYLNLMDQYRPSYHADQFPELNRPVSVEEYRIALGETRASGLWRLDRGGLY